MLPILLLVAVSLTKGVKPAVLGADVYRYRYRYRYVWVGHRGQHPASAVAVRPFGVVGLAVAYFRKSPSLPLREPLGKLGSVLVVLFPSVAIGNMTARIFSRIPSSQW